MAEVRVDIDPAVLSWAVGYSRREDVLRRKFGSDLLGWLSGDRKPTPQQLDAFAAEARVPFAYMYGDIIPNLELHMSDLRDVGGSKADAPTPDMIDTAYACHFRHGWYSDYLEGHGRRAPDFTGSSTIRHDPATAARSIRDALGWEGDAPAGVSADTYRRWMAGQADAAGILVMVNGSVKEDMDRILDPAEFRGLSLIDETTSVSLIFLNGREPLSSQALSLAHGLAHVWLGEEGACAPDHWLPPDSETERWCNAVAGEVLVPGEALLEAAGGSDVSSLMSEMQSRFEVSRLVMLRRLMETGLMPPDEFAAAYRSELLSSRAEVPDAMLWMPGERLGRRFIEAVYTDTVNGGTFYTEGYDLLEDWEEGDPFNTVGEWLKATAA